MIRAKKSLGQNFLTSQSALREILAVGRVSKGDMVLEIGPGKGFLTRALLEKAGKVITVEKDKTLCKKLATETFPKEIHSGNLLLHCGDILQTDILKIFPKGYTDYKVIANIPYYITGKIIRLFLTTTHKPRLMTLMLQNEVAQRIVASDGKESVLSVSVKAYGTPKYIKKIPAKYFTPKPNVDSAILLIDNVDGKKFKDKDEEKLFFRLVKSGFSSRRKKLSNNLALIFDQHQTDISDAFNRCDINTMARAEELSVEKWLCLARLLH